MLADDVRGRLLGVAVLALVVVMLLSALASAMEPPARVANGGQVIGRTAFAYLGGLRTFAAFVLWNRIDPQYHEYYEGASMDRMTFMLPTLRLLQTLDPQFQETYYVGAWIVARRGDRKTGIDIARDGITANPDSGLMRANLISLLTLDEVESKRKDVHLAEELELARSGLGRTIQWNSESDRFESYALFADVFRRAGNKSQADAIAAELNRIKARGFKSNAELELEEQQEEGNE